MRGDVPGCHSSYVTLPLYFSSGLCLDVLCATTLLFHPSLAGTPLACSYPWSSEYADADAVAEAEAAPSAVGLTPQRTTFVSAQRLTVSRPLLSSPSPSHPRRTACFCARISDDTMSDAVAGGARSTGDKPTDYRLPTDVVPTHYELAFKTDLAAAKPYFSGEALIDLDVKNTTKKLVFNVHPSVKVTNIALSVFESKTAAAVHIPLKAYSTDSDQERGTVDLASLPGGELKAGAKAKLFLRWENELGGNMVGYYLSEAEADENGKKQT